jgi:hypothetical protein
MEQIGQEADRWISGTGSGSVLQAAATYKMPIVPQGAIAVAGIGEGIWDGSSPRNWILPTDRLRRIMFADPVDQPARPDTSYAVEPMMAVGNGGRDDLMAMAGALEKYAGDDSHNGRARVMSAFPNAFAIYGSARWVRYQVERLAAGGCPARNDMGSDRLFASQSCGPGLSANWVTVQVSEPGTDYPMFGW